MKFQDQKVSKGSSHISQKLQFEKDKYMLENMQYNMAFIYELKNLNKKNGNQISSTDKDKLLTQFQLKYKNYRKNWINIDKLVDENYNFKNPLCLDIETASICDLACPHCFREYIVTPDKIMKEELYLKIMREVKELEIPSVKLNWRGEPLLNPLIDKFISIAKQNGVLDVSINTNATTLDEKKSKKILNSGLDQIIFSFDGGTKSTYEKMRPGRFKDNKFDKIYENIKNFCLMKKKDNKKFPITKIQMVMTKDSRNEVKNFHDLFSNLIDDVVITQYQERGGKMDDLLPEQKEKLDSYVKDNNNKKINQYIAKVNGDILISEKRKPCDQIYQRLMVTYNGNVGMCCHDWGAKHCLGYLDDDGIKDNDKDLRHVYNNTKKNKKGFELLQNIKMPEKYNEPEKKVSTLNDIWLGKELKRVRDKHNSSEINSIEICKNCSYKASYHWKKI